MNEEIRSIAAQEGWTDATLVSVLLSVLDQLAEQEIQSECRWGHEHIVGMVREQALG